MEMTIIRAMALSFALAAFPPTVSAQTATGEGNGESRLPGLAQGVNALASDLETNIQNLRRYLNDSTTGDAKIVFDKLEASVGRVHDALDEDSDVWIELTRAMEVWDERRKHYLEEARKNPSFDAIAEEWKIRLDEASTLRSQILAQRTESVAMLDQLLEQRGVVLAYYELGQADRALDLMQKVSDDLGEMSEKMREMNEQAKVVEGEVTSK